MNEVETNKSVKSTINFLLRKLTYAVSKLLLMLFLVLLLPKIIKLRSQFIIKTFKKKNYFI